jgi:tetratricopeptide (TPR) repeat protein
MTKNAKSTTGFLAGLGVLIVIGGGLGFLLYHGIWAKRDALAREITGYSPQNGIPPDIDGLKKAIAYYEKRVEEHIQDAAKAGAYWKILGTRFRDKKMHFESLDAFSHALRYTPDDPTVNYLIGVEAATAAKSAYMNDSGNDSPAMLYARAEKAFKRAIALAPGYTQAILALGVLYTFDLNRPHDAIPLFSNYSKYKSNDTDALFVLARAYYMTGDYQSALKAYDSIITKSKNKQKVEEAKRNRDFIMKNH